MTKRIKFSQILITFFVVSLCTFGGGYAMLPMLQQEVVDRREWITKEELIDLFAVAQGLPGIIGINIACLICSRICGKVTTVNEKPSDSVYGNTDKEKNSINNAEKDTSIKKPIDTDGDKTPNTILANIVASLGVMSPCIIIILLIAILLGQFREIEVVQHALAGIALCVLALILRTVIRMWKSSIKSIPQIFLFLVATAVTIFTGISPIITIIVGAVFGIVAGLLLEKKNVLAINDAPSDEIGANKKSNGMILDDDDTEGGGK